MAVKLILAFALCVLTFSVDIAAASTLSPSGKRQLAEILKKERAAADVVVIGYWQGEEPPCDTGGACNGDILPTKVTRGKREASYRLSYISYIDLYRGTNQPPPAPICAKFYLARLGAEPNAAYKLLQYEELQSESRACSIKS